jgi:hypothetical protein
VPRLNKIECLSVIVFRGNELRPKPSQLLGNLPCTRRALKLLVYYVAASVMTKKALKTLTPGVRRERVRYEGARLADNLGPRGGQVLLRFLLQVPLI